MKRVLPVGLLSMMIAIGVVSASVSLASDASRGNVLERIGQGGSIYQSKSGRVGDCRTKVDVIERIGHGGSTYSSSQSKSVQVGDCHLVAEREQSMDVVERIGQGGSTYSSKQRMSN
jgi:hypothetical protein